MISPSISRAQAHDALWLRTLLIKVARAHRWDAHMWAAAADHLALITAPGAPWEHTPWAIKARDYAQRHASTNK